MTGKAFETAVEAFLASADHLGQSEGNFKKDFNDAAKLYRAAEEAISDEKRKLEYQQKRLDEIEAGLTEIDRRVYYTHNDHDYITINIHPRNPSESDAKPSFPYRYVPIFRYGGSDQAGIFACLRSQFGGNYHLHKRHEKRTWAEMREEIVVLKIATPRRSYNARTRIANEVRALRAIKAHLGNLNDGEDKPVSPVVQLSGSDHAYFSMYRIQGAMTVEHLQQTAETSKVPLPERVCLDLAIQLTAALRFLHDTCQIAHNNLTPTNIIISKHESTLRGQFVGFSRARYTIPGMASGRLQDIEALYGILTKLVEAGATKSEDKSPRNKLLERLKKHEKRDLLYMQSDMSFFYSTQGFEENDETEKQLGQFWTLAEESMKEEERLLLEDDYPKELDDILEREMDRLPGSMTVKLEEEWSQEPWDSSDESSEDQEYSSESSSESDV